MQLLPVDWKNIQKEVKEHPEYVKRLVARLSAEEIDTTMTLPERILAFYGQSFLTNDAEEKYRIDMDKLAEAGKIEECLAMAKNILEINPLHLKALVTAGNSLIVMAKDSTRWKDVTIEDGRRFFRRAILIFDTIAMTGDGSASRPFSVTKVSDEYCFMRYYLNLWDYKKQTLSGNCDVITLDGSSDYYDEPEIYFEITRVLELERLLFK